MTQSKSCSHDRGWQAVCMDPRYLLKLKSTYGMNDVLNKVLWWTLSFLDEGHSSQLYVDMQLTHRPRNLRLVDGQNRDVVLDDLEADQRVHILLHQVRTERQSRSSSGSLPWTLRWRNGVEVRSARLGIDWKEETDFDSWDKKDWMWSQSVLILSLFVVERSHTLHPHRSPWWSSGWFDRLHLWTEWLGRHEHPSQDGAAPTQQTWDRVRHDLILYLTPTGVEWGVT